MESQVEIITGKNIEYNHTLASDKHYFGGFFNIAQNNINRVFDEFCLRLNINCKNISPLKIINNLFTDEISYTDWDKRILILKEYFPVIDYLDLDIENNLFTNIPLNQKEKEKRAYFKNTFKALITSIHNLRNFYTHAYHSPVEINDSCFDFIDNTQLQVCKLVKKKKLKTDKTREVFKKGIAKELNKLKDLKLKDLKEKQKDDPKIKIPTGIALDNAIFNDAFKHFLFKNIEEDTIELLKFRKSRFDTPHSNEIGTPVSMSGLIFLLSMFLSRKEVEQLKSNIKYYKGKVFGEDHNVTLRENSLRNMATHWVYSYLSFKGLKQRVKNTFDKETLLMQMADELSKVPHEIYRNLNNTDKKEFLEDINEYMQDGDEDKNLENSTVIHPVIRKRYENKFLYFAIRFLDEFADFPSLKFHVFAGNYLHNTMNKPIGKSNFISSRQIKERIHVFGKLSEVSKYKSDYFIDNENEIGWELYPNPSYNFVGNNIPIFINPSSTANKNTDGNIIGEAKKTLNYIATLKEEKKVREKRIAKNKVIQQIYGTTKSITHGNPTAFLSANEIPALLYEFLVQGKTGEELEEIIITKMVERYNAISNFNTEQKYSQSVMTKKLLKSKTSDGYDYNKLAEAIKKELDVTHEKLALINKNRKEYEDTKNNKQRNNYYQSKNNGTERKYIFYTNELGQEATWLANDIKRFMPKAAREEWKGIHHSELQKLLAFYDRHKTDAKNLLFSNWNYNVAPTWGKAIAKCFDDNHTFENFYKNYLDTRRKILNEFCEQLKNHSTLPPKLLNKLRNTIFSVFKKRLYAINNTNKQKIELLTKPIVFPRGLFDDKPTFIKNVKYEESPESFAKWYRYCYDNKELLQHFYHTPLDYADNFKVQKESNKEIIKNSKNLLFSDKIALFKKKEDYTIKKIKHQDIFTKLMLNYIFNKTFNVNINFSLQDFYQTKEQRNANYTIANAQKKREKNDKSENIYNRNFIWNKTVEITLFGGKVIEPTVKLKDIGKYRKMESDEKIKTILSYNIKHTWSKIQLEDELENKPDSYERLRREKILKKLHEFENAILINNGFNGVNHPEDFEYDKNPNFRLYVANGVLKHSHISGHETLLERLEDIAINDILDCNETVIKAYILIALRNKFAHNQLPNEEIFKLINKYYPYNDSETCSLYFYNVITNIITEFTLLLNVNYN